MFKKLAEKLQSLAQQRSPFDPLRFDDPIAVQTAWSPLKNGGTNFRTHRLVEHDSARLEFRAAAGAKLFYLVFFFVGVGALVGVSYANIRSGEFGFNGQTIMPILIGFVFALAGGCLFYFGTAPIVFDRRRGYFWKGRKSPDEVFDKTKLKRFAELQDIHALQLISEYVSGNKNSYYSYELNLVLKDGSRTNVVDHGSIGRLREDADTLSAFLEKPVWDAV